VRIETIFVSIIHGHNEFGAINDVFKIAKGVKETNKNIIFHTDASQSFCKTKIDLKNDGSHIDMVTIVGHKIGAPKGVAALYVRSNINHLVDPLLHGGGQEKGIRSGTENTSMIIGFSVVVDWYAQNLLD